MGLAGSPHRHRHHCYSHCLLLLRHVFPLERCARLYQAQAAWFETGKEGHGHEKPWEYWLRLSGRYELAIVFGLVACLFCLRFRNVATRYLAIYGVGTVMAYSIVKYKTPWCIISVVWPLLFVFGALSSLVPVRLRGAGLIAYGSLLVAGLITAVCFAVAKDYAYSLALGFCGGGPRSFCGSAPAGPDPHRLKHWSSSFR